MPHPVLRIAAPRVGVRGHQRSLQQVVLNAQPEPLAAHKVVRLLRSTGVEETIVAGGGENFAGRLHG